MAHERFDLEVRLQGIEPAIWRAIEMPGSASLEDVHYALQVAMGWTNSHLHRFEIGKTQYGMAGTEDMELEDEREYRLQDVVKSGQAFMYEYDFGDGWEHEVKVKQVVAVAKPVRPRCVAGERACPPEDCGGPSGYEDLLAVLADPSHADHEETAQWAEDFEPERFALPKKGMELRVEMDRYKELADEGEEGDDLGLDGRPSGLPKQLVQAVLALEPMQRATLGALITGSLAEDLIEARLATQRVVSAMRATVARGQPAKRKRRG